MNEFRILNATLPSDRFIWQSAWNAWSDKEVFSHPGFIRLFDNPNHQSLCAYYRDEQGEVLFPFQLRDLALESWCPANLKAKDFISPYGYGGPFAWESPSIEGFWEGFAAWCRKTGVVSGFFRRGLFGDQLLPLLVEEVLVSENIVRTLHLSTDALWMAFEHKVRKNVNKARRSGLTCTIDPTGGLLDDFIKIYHSTMQRRKAGDFFYFDEAFFKSMLNDIPEFCMFFHVADSKGKIVSSELVLVSQNHIYSFLGGTLPEAMPFGTNDLLKLAIIEWGREQGFDSFVLGGGFQPDDGIFRYKRAFAPDGVVPFKVGRWVLDQSTYKTLVNHRKNWEGIHGRNWVPAEGFFPAYRAPGQAVEPHLSISE